jgi:UDP-N-acetylmuramoyl-L-alanyl-D-glutamate--2,6-diaminopimelate ligase
MQLRALLDGLGAVTVEGGADPDVHGVAADSRRVDPGDVFFALAGQATDGRRHVSEAVARGAVAVVADGQVHAPDVVRIRCATPRRLLAYVAARLAGDPSAALTLVGVTGTNGKTTTTYLLEGIWRAAGAKPGVIGTIAYRFADITRPAPFTTPEAPDLQAMLAEMRRAGVTHVAMEVSSHALAQHRADALRFDAAAFSNLTRDHLDFHRDDESYYTAKARLFRELLPESGKAGTVAVVNVDDPAGARLAAEVSGRCVRVGRGAGVTVRLWDVESTLAGTRGVLVLDGQRLAFDSPLVGAPHAENIALASGIAWALGTELPAIAAGIATTLPPPGRVERFAGPGFTVVVDYAHSPDALERVLAALRPLTPGALITVFGCGGDRDRGKRPLMGRAAGTASDLVVITSDNPRTENPLRILADVEPGVRSAGMTRLAHATAGARGYVVEPDRRAAITLAVGLARAGDLVVVAGKGHEDYQIIGTEKRHLDDREEVRRALEQRETQQPDRRPEQRQ